MIRVAIVDDEQTSVNLLSSYLQQLSEEGSENFHITVYSDGEEVVENYKAQFDIILMDVQMRFMNGMEAAKRIRQMDKEVTIIFVTNMAQYAIHGYKVGALDYILKPFNYFAFSQRLVKALDKVHKDTTNYITVPVKGGAYRVDVADIYYVESQKHMLIYHTKLGDIETYGTMKEAEKEFEKMHFCRGNKGYLINLAQVVAIRDNHAIIRGEKLALSRTRKNQFMENLSEYWGA